MKTFVLLLTYWAAEPGPEVFVIDYNLTGEDCTAAMVEYSKGYQGAGILSCEFDLGQGLIG